MPDFDAPAKKPTRRPFVWPRVWLRRIAIGLGLAAGIGSLAGYVIAVRIVRSLPPVTMDPPKVITRVLDNAGNPIQSFGEERRFLVRYEQISPYFFTALIAVEDADFYNHKGIKPKALVRGVVWNLLRGKRPAGGSTLTQQLAKNYFLTNERSISRKLKEMALAIRLEKTYSKQQILELYANKVNFGHARYGIEEGSRFYFGKTAKELTLLEAAFLAGVVQSPTNRSPIKNPTAALSRRNVVLRRMLDTGKLPAADYEKLKLEPLEIDPHWAEAGFAPYFVDEVRRQAEHLVGEGKVAAGGFDIYTTLDPGLQRIAEKSVAYGLSQFEHRHGFRRADIINLKDDEINVKQLTYPEWNDPPEIGGFMHGVVETASEGSATIRLGRDSKAPLGRLVAKGAAWTGCKKLNDCLKPLDLVFVRIKGVEGDNSTTLLITLEQESDANAAFIAIDNSTGAVRAMVGGNDYSISKYNRAVQAKRQTGSAIKPLMYAAAIATGMSPATMLADEPTCYLQDGASCRNCYSPKNSHFRFAGRITMRHSIEQSINVSSVELLAHSGYKIPIELAKKAGITAPLRAYPSLALGAFEISLLELTSAYTVFPMGGEHIQPFLISKITDREGNIKYQNTVHTDTAMTPQVAAVTTELLRGVVQRGTAASAAALGQPLAGKTGTTDDYSNAWFIGFTPTLTAGAWVGYDNPKSLGRGEEGARTALPIWIAFMRDARTDPVIKGVQFPEPSGLTKVMIDRRTGLRAAIDSHCNESDLIEETFIVGQEPPGFCSEAAHVQANLPWMLQAFDLGEDMHARISPSQLNRLTSKFPGLITVNPENTAVSITTIDKKLGTQQFEVPLTLVDEPVAGADDMGQENWHCNMRTMVMDSGR